MSFKRSLALAATLTLSAQAMADDPLKSALFYVGPIGITAGATSNDQGRPGHGKNTLVTRCRHTMWKTSNGGRDAERTNSPSGQAGNDVIFTTSFGFMNPTAR